MKLQILALTAGVKERRRFVSPTHYCGCSGGAADGAVCSGAGVGGGVAVVSVGGETGSKYQTMINATTTAAAMMSNLVRSIGALPFLQLSLSVAGLI
jgi:hypothetical protein